MAPFPENDNTPKAPDKSDKVKSEKQSASDVSKEKVKEAKTVSNLNDGELKALLDEAITYKNPKDREGKSKLFKDLLSEAEESERNARAASAGGSELVRYCNPSAKRGNRHRRKPSSISENMMHGGSLDNLAKEDLYEPVCSQQKTRKSVSARQREGGSLPCNVNSSALATYDYQFIEEARRKKAMQDKECAMESERLPECPEKEYPDPPHLQSYANLPNTNTSAITAKFTTKATFQISNADVDEAIQLSGLDGSCDKKQYDIESLHRKVQHNKFDIFIPTCNYSSRSVDDRKVDENGNALHQSTNTKNKKKKIQTADKNVIVLASEKVEGHRGDIIDDVDKLMEYIGGTTEALSKTKSNIHKSKQLHKQHTTDDGSKSKKHRAHSSKGKEPRGELKKSNSMGEISTTNLVDHFGLEQDLEEVGVAKVVLRNKHGSSDRPRERRSWGNVEPPPFQSLYNNASVENLEATTEKWVVTKTKKKSKRRRNSVSNGRRQNSASESSTKNAAARGVSPDLRRKSACSAPHSDKSNDSSDADSVHSLPVDGLNVPISYADIAKNREKKLTPEKPLPVKEKSPVGGDFETPVKNEIKPKQSSPVSSQTQVPVVAEKSPPPPAVQNSVPNSPPQPQVVVTVTNSPPDVHNIKSFPAITNNRVQVAHVHVNAVEKTNNTKNSGNSVVCGKVKNSCAANPTGGVKTVKNNVNKMNNVAHLHNSHHIDIQTDLSIIQANEKDSIQFNAQMLPPDIPDVQTIEKMHFLNHAHKQHQQVPKSPPSPPAATPPSHTYQPIPRVHHQVTPPCVSQHTQTTPARHPTIPDDANAVNNCDSSERTTSVSSSVDANTVTDEGELESPPPVVILSGLGNKEVSGLVFGFDVNEQLLSEDICENFIARYVAPEVFNQASHNHDKIVNFIGLAWEDVIVNQSNGRVQYYTDSL